MGQGMTVLLLGLVVGSAPAQPAEVGKMSLPDRYLGVRMQPLLLLSRADVRADIGLDAQQAEEVDKAILDFAARAFAVRGVTGPAVLEARRAIDVDAQKWLETHLTEPQYRRLIQVDLQWEGPSSLISRPVIADHLELTPEQRQQLEQALATRNKQRLEYEQAFAARNNSRPPDTFRQEFEYAFVKKARAVLTPKQRHLWAEMAGPTFHPRLAADSAHTTARPTQ